MSQSSDKDVESRKELIMTKEFTYRHVRVNIPHGSVRLSLQILDMWEPGVYRTTDIHT